jgi:hypothetical protein
MYKHSSPPQVARLSAKLHCKHLIAAKKIKENEKDIKVLFPE